MPRVASLSGISTVSPIRCSPRARIVARLRAMWLIVLLTWVTRSLAATVALPAPVLGRRRDAHGRRRDLARLTRDERAELHAAASAQLFGRVQAAQRLDRRPRDVDGIGGALDLGQDVADPGRLDDGPDRATGDDAGALRGRLQHHLR